MRRTLLSPSLLVSRLLNIEKTVRDLEAAGADMIHVDLIDTSFADIIGLPTLLLPMLKEISGIPLDIHLMVANPERMLPVILPYCKDDYVVIQFETTREFNVLAEQIRKANAKPGVAINSSTSVGVLSEAVYAAEIINVMMSDSGRNPFVSQSRWRAREKLRQIQAMCKTAGREDVLLECDMGIRPEEIEPLRESGADVFVLGQDSIFFQKDSEATCLRNLKEKLNDLKGKD